MRRVLLDTNIIIHRENTRVTNKSIGLLFYWLDTLNMQKAIHPATITELRKYKDSEMQTLYDVKLSAYHIMKSFAPQSPEFLSLLGAAPKSENDVIDAQLLCEVFCGRADFLITEDRKMRAKALSLGIADRVFSIDSFIGRATDSNPQFVKYKALSVQRELFGTIDVSNGFFDTFHADYHNFSAWFARKCDEQAYVCRSDSHDILGFLYLKIEDSSEIYDNITPPFTSKRRLKVGTFKVNSTGFRLGERFIKIIFDNAIKNNVDEIYVTLFNNRPELQALSELLTCWGFRHHGAKISNGSIESVLVKTLGSLSDNLSARENFPNVNYSSAKFFLPISPKYHTSLLPDSILNTEAPIDFLGKDPQKYALEKVYISYTHKRNMVPGDIVLIYRNGETEGRKAYQSVVTTIGVIHEVKFDFINKDDFMNYVRNRTVFTHKELEKIWDGHHNKMRVIKFIHIQSLTKKLPLKFLWENKIIKEGSGPRPFDSISDTHFNQILHASQTTLYGL